MKILLRTFLFSFFSLLVATGMQGQIIIAVDDFDNPVNLISVESTTDAGTVANHLDPFSSNGDHFGITGGVSNSGDVFQAPFALVDDAIAGCPGFFAADNFGVVPCNYGNNFFGIVDADNGDNPSGDIEAVWNFDISLASMVSQICIDMGAMGDWEAADVFDWSYSIDGGASTSIFTLVADEAASANYTTTNPQTLNDPMTVNGTPLLNGLTTFCVPVTGSGNVLTLTLTGNQNAGEAYAFDNITIVAAAIIPTVGEWGLITLALLFLNLIVFFGIGQGAGQMVLANHGTKVMNFNIPFEKETFLTSVKWVAGLVLIIALVNIGLFGVIEMVDIIGTMITAPILAYLVHQILLYKE